MFPSTTPSAAGNTCGNGHGISIGMHEHKNWYQNLSYAYGYFSAYVTITIVSRGDLVAQAW